MPELPEVECWGRRFAEAICAGRTIVRADVRPDSIVFGDITPTVFGKALRNRVVVACHRRGKQMWWELGGAGPHPLMHFGMTGHFHAWADPGKEALLESVLHPRAGRHIGRVMHEEPPGPPPLTWTKFLLTLDHGLHFAMTDKRRFARITLRSEPLAEPPLSALGPDAWLELPPLRWFEEKLAARRTSIKAVLLNQTFLAGIGNWIADEVLYQARLDPSRLACGLLPAEVRKLRGKIRYVLHKAVEWEADYTRFSPRWLFHQRWGLRDSRKETLQDAAGHAIAFDTVAGRTTCWVPALQK